MLDGFSGYNQVLVVEEDRTNITFVTPWETYAYVCMPFGLKNDGYNFQREMDHAFKYLIGNFMVDDEDDLSICSKLREENIKHLIVFLECFILYDISLNPKKCLFSLLEGRLLGHIVSKKGIHIDPKKIKSINDINPQTSKKEFNIDLKR
jgi:hypothetical protein